MDANTDTYANDKFKSAEQENGNVAPAVNLSTETVHLVSSETSLYSNTENNEITDPNQKLSKLKKNNLGRLIIGHLNINSLRNKFEALKTMVKGKVDILMVSETKIDESFPMAQFSIEGFTNSFRQDRDHEGSGIIVYVRDDIPCK